METINNNTTYKFKDIHIGKMIEERWSEKNINIVRTCNFLKVTELEIKEMFLLPDMNSQMLLRWSKLLEYDFFRIYSQHLILYAPPSSTEKNTEAKNGALPVFRKNIYTKEIIDFIMERLNNKEKTKFEIMKEYGIPKSTLYKWIHKYNDKP
ncbi:transposase [Chryseobacterium bernardetii]|uniref:Transposase n=1 Tax=Chryseobacterium bernardetii TaxID=1241978 RepID=A0A3G6TDS4_9FLAO|nr:helix-turn-helix domain-containing protein [Chryseobacterium bernardetii]AZB27395.1 transposase [Chryseobacterium bernardetii]